MTILSKIREQLPKYDYLYLGDNARAPYGTRSFPVIYDYTLQAVRYLQSQGCRLIILACNTASAKALRTIQQHDIDPDRLRVLGVIRPTVEVVPSLTRNGHIGILATPGTVSSESYVIELKHQMSAMNEKMSTINCQLSIIQQSCPLWVPLIEAGEHDSDGADFFVRKYLDELLARDPLIDTIVLGCTHYPLLLHKIEEYLQGKPITVISQGELVANSLADYLIRHPEIERDCSKGGTCRYLTTEAADRFSDSARIFINQPVTAEHVSLEHLEK